ncbi:GDSL-type esterase/lipase family protein [Hyphomicrobium sp. LHD-15]|uniref:GDSL-type esterase/lipase family protein n=1 Tax=Hyphomicrobium sp. LHD-15 TaxID=3072142 RepID=UPI00280F4E11|nr:GDSL-type esterase/lipase family protein [Hyphomicrobium sp. LHD-15]MDQ8700240.1 GDSL-type esterase/lipase family protein [Hyphomicrobium sp. LHD-15]
MIGLAAMDPALAETAANAAMAKQEGSRTIRVLPLGDSITQGGRSDRPEYTYRYPLYFMLKDAGYDVDFIGSQHAGLEESATWPDRNGVAFDPDHEGHYGWTTAEVRNHLQEWLSKYPAPPDIALIDLGSNDQEADSYQTAIVEPLKDIVAMLREKNPNVVVLLGHILANGRKARSIRPLLEQVARETRTPVSPVETVLHYKNWHERPGLPYSDTFDWAHPNPSGQRKMADNYFAAMRPYLDRLQSGEVGVAHRAQSE